MKRLNAARRRRRCLICILSHGASGHGVLAAESRLRPERLRRAPPGTASKQGLAKAKDVLDADLNVPTYLDASTRMILRLGFSSDQSTRSPMRFCVFEPSRRSSFSPSKVRVGPPRTAKRAHG
jgi:hypothetical protein